MSGLEILEPLCVKCSRLGPTCCQDCEIFVTNGDVKRISDHIGRNGFYEYRQPENPVYLQQHDDPIWMENAFQTDGTRRVLKRKANGDCSFLAANGCTLPMEVRPLVCRLYPYDFTVEGLKELPTGGCPVELLPPGQSLFDAVGASLEDARRWHGMLYEELVTPCRSPGKNNSCESV